ncbi:MAG TPA: hypothetical protein VIQ11_10385 [Mycobacterium sp.]
MQGVRGATGALVLSTALLIGSAAGAIATADTGTGDPTPRSSRAPDTADRDSAGASRQSPQSSVRDVVRGAASAVESRLDRVPASEEPEADAATTDDAAATDGTDEPAATVEDAVAVDADLAEEQPVLTLPVTVPGPVLPVIEIPAPVVPVTVPDVAGGAPSAAGGGNGGGFHGGAGSSTPSDPVAAAPGSDGQDEPAATDESAPGRSDRIIRVVSTVTTVVVSLGNAVAAVPPVVLALPFSSTPVTDVITMIETVLASVAESATAAARLPSDLAALFGLDLIGTAPGGIVVPSDRTLMPVVATETPVEGVPTASPLLPIVPEQSVVDVAASTRPSLFIPAALASFSAPLNPTPEAAPTAAGEHRSLIDRVFGGLLVPLSLWALAAGALPGLAGLLVLLGAGVRVGYRQAKAGIAVRVAGIGRFAGPGPLGVVRSASLIALHQRKTGDRMGSHGPLLGDQVA